MALPMPVPTPPTPQERERFWRHVEKRPDGCWVWTAALFTSGYGAFFLRGSTRRAHRVLYVWTHGEHDQEVLDHVCENRACVNPDHLRPVSQRENTLIGDGPTARNYQKEKTDKGEEYDRIDSRGWRFNAKAGAASSRRYYAANREEINARKRARRVKVTYGPRPCENCGKPFTPERSTGHFCKRPECVNARQREGRARRSAE